MIKSYFKCFHAPEEGSTFGSRGTAEKVSKAVGLDLGKAGLDGLVEVTTVEGTGLDSTVVDELFVE